jgi:RNA polymerase sigma factor (sigma-70 family)
MSPLVSSLRFLQTQTDARLVALARDGHERAFEAIVCRYRRQLLAYARRLLGTGAGADDVLQQALLQAWVALQRQVEVADVRAWLHRIVHNVAVSTFRVAGEALAVSDEAPSGHATDHEVEQRIAVRHALASLAALPELQRAAMVSMALDGRSHEEIASSLGLTSGAVRGLIYRARTTLRAAAAAVIPAPVIQWAARQGPTQPARSSGLYEAIAGSGSAGVGGVLLKGGALLASAGAIAAAAGVTSSHPGRDLTVGASRAAAAAGRAPHRPRVGVRGVTLALRSSDEPHIDAHPLRPLPRTLAAPAPARARGDRGRADGGVESRDGGEPAGSGGGERQRGDGSSGGSSSGSSGADGGPGPSSGSSSASSDGGSTSGSGSSDGGSTSGSGSSDGGLDSATALSASTGGGHDGSGDSTTTTTTTTTTDGGTSGGH